MVIQESIIRFDDLAILISGGNNIFRINTNDKELLEKTAQQSSPVNFCPSAGIRQCNLDKLSEFGKKIVGTISLFSGFESIIVESTNEIEFVKDVIIDWNMLIPRILHVFKHFKSTLPVFLPTPSEVAEYKGLYQITFNQRSSYIY